MNYTAIVSRLMPGDGWFFFHNRNGCVRIFSLNVERTRQTNDAGTYDRDVKFGVQGIPDQSGLKRSKTDSRQCAGNQKSLPVKFVKLINKNVRVSSHVGQDLFEYPRGGSIDDFDLNCLISDFVALSGCDRAGESFTHQIANER